MYHKLSKLINIYYFPLSFSRGKMWRHCSYGSWSHGTHFTFLPKWILCFKKDTQTVITSSSPHCIRTLIGFSWSCLQLIILSTGRLCVRQRLWYLGWGSAVESRVKLNHYYSILTTIFLNITSNMYKYTVYSIQ